MEKYLAGFLSPAIFPLTLIAIGMWIYAEFKCGVKQRLLYGVLAFLLSIGPIAGARLYAQGYKEYEIRNCLYVIKEQMKLGNYQPISEALTKFETNEQNHGFAHAARELGNELGTIQNQSMKKTFNQEDTPGRKPAR